MRIFSKKYHYSNRFYFFESLSGNSWRWQNRQHNFWTFFQPMSWFRGGVQLHSQNTSAPHFSRVCQHFRHFSESPPTPPSLWWRHFWMTQSSSKCSGHICLATVTDENWIFKSTWGEQPVGGFCLCFANVFLRDCVCLFAQHEEDIPLFDRMFICVSVYPWPPD